MRLAIQRSIVRTLIRYRCASSRRVTTDLECEGTTLALFAKRPRFSPPEIKHRFPPVKGGNPLSRRAQIVLLAQVFQA